ncbi:MAG: pyruvate dehydrogenase (acetyl-transferring) E1 component subunit alpha [Spirochaetota bacterium]|nr:pyruvate dehydrogenase (acetyl-transferring) E1 component subunit alpha [Spirochaetota bacterium]
MSIVTKFEIHYVQYINEKGEELMSLPAFAKDKEILISLYRFMVLTRIYDAKAIALQRTGKMGTFASSLGQEAVSVGIGNALQKEDVFCPYYRDQGAMFQRGIKISELLSFWGGDEWGSHYANNKEDFSIAIPIGTQLLHAAGIAYAIKLRKQKRAVVVTCGDGASSEGDFYHAINAAGIWKLPLVIVINNNQWAISVPRTRQSGTKTLAQKAIAGGIDGVQVDGNDVIAVRHIVSEALDKARGGDGPTLIEALTYRLCDHTTADDASRYIDKADLERAWNLEPLSRFYSYLIKNNYITEKLNEKIHEECNQQVEDSVEEYLNIPLRLPESMFDYLYAKLPVPLKEQRDEIEGLANE